MTVNMLQTEQVIGSKQQKTGSSCGMDMRGILGNMKASELPLESIDEFSCAPFEFEETAKWLWEDTQITYYHAGIENRFSENYLKLCGRLETNIRRLGSFCLTKTVLEEKGGEFPELSNLNVRELVKMVSFHLRKCHAAFQGMYHDNNFLGMSYLNWEFRWFELGNRLKATEVKIVKIREGKINAESILQQAEQFSGEPQNDCSPENGFPGNLPVNEGAVPIEGSMARDMIRREREAEKEQRREESAHQRNERDVYRPAKPFGVSSAFPLLKQFFDRQERQRPEPEPCPAEVQEPVKAEEPEQKLRAGEITEAEARSILIRDAMERGDEESLMAIPLEDRATVHARWERYRARFNSGPPSRPGISAETRKKLREKRKKKKR